MLRRLCFTCLLAGLVPAAALAAEGSFTTYGPRIGFSTDPSQIVLGGQLELGEVAPDIDFVPSVDLGFGDHTTLVSLNGDFHYRFTVEGQKWQPYAGAGIALHFFTFDNPGPFVDHSDTAAGGSLIVGADVPTDRGSRFFVEGKFALGDGPSFKLLAGWNFKMR